MIVPASRERERDFTVHTCTSLLWERDVYIFVPTSCERERLYYTYLYQYILWERDVYIFVPTSCERERFVHILVPDSRPLVRSSERV